ncbi:hypothetical protein OG596_37680 [Streptomyces sp. NBC_01102]|uniref:hypothetical protein n=1 Tax=unclassified Streptomyces TaxID=2593676 RepID=UPI003869D507|nr:hypothetical protein OG596_00240 [Streptomyces sp. NBC_01102]WSU70690.1 hypothetical protein OG596_37680 [Streptomyces sp. NBC_01102]
MLASDGAYEPHEDADHDLSGYLTGAPRTAAERLVGDAVRRVHERNDPYADNVTVFVSHITQEGEEHTAIPRPLLPLVGKPFVPGAVARLAGE